MQERKWIFKNNQDGRDFQSRCHLLGFVDATTSDFVSPIYGVEYDEKNPHVDILLLDGLAEDWGGKLVD